MPKLLFALIILLFALYGSFFIKKTSFFQNGKHYYCLFDDAMISMTYAKNAVNGYGLNWAKFGEPVEGFTHPLWTFMMIPIQLIPVGIEMKSLFVQLISLLLLVFTLIYIKKLTQLLVNNARSYIWLIPVILTATYYPLLNWSLQGMETGLQALMITASFYYLFMEDTISKRNTVKICIILALSLILRMDMLLFVLLVIFYLVLTNKPKFKRILLALSIIFTPFFLYLIFRYFYFHDFLPNTYYLKMTGISAEIRVLRGLSVFIDFVNPILPVLILTILLSLVFARNLKIIALIGCVFIQFAYSVYVGGDAWEWSSIGANRFVSFAMPMLFVLLAIFTDEIIRKFSLFKCKIYAVLFGFIMLVFSFLSFNGLLFSKQSQEKWNNIILKNHPLHYVYHYYMVEKVNELNKITSQDAVIATVQAGICGYYSQFKLTDIMGYNDKYIAKGPVYFKLTKKNYKEFVPGHVKLNYDYTINKVKPDIIYDTWGIQYPEIKIQLDTLLEKYYNEVSEKFWVRKGSENVCLNRISEIN